GGTVKRYEIHPDPERLKEKGITLQQLQDAVAASNATVGGDYLKQGDIVQVVRNLGVIGGARDPMEKAFAMRTPAEAAAYLRAAENRRIREIRDVVITANNGKGIRVDDVVQGGPVLYDVDLGRYGVVVGHQTRLGRISMSRPLDADGKSWRYEREK